MIRPDDLAASPAASAWLDAWRTNLLEHGVSLERTKELLEAAIQRAGTLEDPNMEEVLEEVSIEELTGRAKVRDAGLDPDSLDDYRRALLAFAQALRTGLNALLSNVEAYLEATRPLVELHLAEETRKRRSAAARRGWETKKAKRAEGSE